MNLRKLAMHRFTWRITLIGMIAVSFSILAAGDLFELTEGQGYEDFSNVTTDENLTVVTGQRAVSLGQESALYGFRGEKMVYYNSTHDDYWDVDPAEGEWTVSYVAADIISRKKCSASIACARMVVEKLDMETGKSKTIYTHVNPIPKGEVGRGYSSRWHDVDLIKGDGLLVADLYEDSVFLINTSTGMREWQWDAQADFSPASGGKLPKDWTHVNDVEMLPDGRVMASLRNQDQVVFIRPERGLLEDWTLGVDDRHRILSGQHNPDYIPEEQGGPAVLVADSGNDRAIEYQRINGSWKKTWSWEDNKINWNRDADRLPNGHTLISDTNTGRVIEVNETGHIVQTIKVKSPYEAERLGTGPESTGGPSAVRANLKSREPGDKEIDTNKAAVVKNLVYSPMPEKVRHGIAFISPGWMGIYDKLSFVVLTVSLIAWTAIEAWWSSIRLQLPITRKP